LSTSWHHCRNVVGLDAAGVRVTNASRPSSLAVYMMTQIFNLIEMGSIIWFVPVSVARRYTRPDIVYRPVLDLPPAGLVVAWPADTRSPAVAAFVRAALAVASAAAPDGPAAVTRITAGARGPGN